MTSSRYFTPPIPNGWFQVAYEDELTPGSVVPLKYFGKDLVLFRTESGEIGLLDAFCPHLGAHLGHGGKVKGENLECPFHAWQFGANGKCNAVPYAKHMPRKADIGTWRIKIVAGLVMAWHHAEGKEPEFELPDELPEFGTKDGTRNPEWMGYEKRKWTIRTNNLDMAENQVDSAHFHYVHGAKNMPQSEGSVDGAIMRVTSQTLMSTPMGEVMGTVQSTSWGFGFNTIRFTGIAETLLVSSVTPIDDDRVDVRFSFMVKSLGGASITKGVGKAFMAEVERQLEQDIPIWENKVQHERPLLCDGDGPIGVFRRWVQQFYSWPADKQPAAAE
ncbi:MAG: Rieske 2Fe-2S domain-containing protein [Polyangiales bacterium]